MSLIRSSIATYPACAAGLSSRKSSLSAGSSGGAGTLLGGGFDDVGDVDVAGAEGESVVTCDVESSLHAIRKPTHMIRLMIKAIILL